MHQSEKMRAWAPVVVRVGLSLVFLWFGSEQILHTAEWIGLIPDWVLFVSGLGADTLAYLNGLFEIIFGAFLLFGFLTRISAFLLALHLLQIVFAVGYNDVGVRDFGLVMATISVFLHGADVWCLDKFLIKKRY